MLNIYECCYVCKDFLFEEYNIDILINKRKMFDFYKSDEINKVYTTQFSLEIVYCGKRYKFEYLKFKSEIEALLIGCTISLYLIKN